MTISALMEQMERLRPNQFSRDDLLRWLNELEGIIYREILLTHESEKEISFTPYTAESDDELLAPDPYSKLYRLYLDAQIAYHNDELAKYNNAAQAFNTAYVSFQNYHNREHRHRQRAVGLRLV